MKQLFRLSILLLALILPVTASAYSFEVDGIYYEDWGDYCVAVVSGDNQYTGDVTIPETVTYDGTTYSVNWIGDYAFYYCSGLTSIDIPNSVTGISSYAFYECSGLTSFDIPDSVTTIGSYAFYNCSGLTSATIGISVQSIGNFAFQGCTSLATLNFNAVSCSNFSSTTSYRPFNNLNISTINIGDSVQLIPAYFANGLVGLTNVTIGKSVTGMGSNAFSGCSGITDLIWNAKNCRSNGNMPTSNIVHVTIGDEVETIPNNFANESKITEFSIPNSVTSIGNYAFNNCSGLSGNLTIPDNVISIGSSAFSNCSGLSGDLIIPDMVTTIGSSAFYNCSGLTSATIGVSVESIGNYAFQGCTSLATLDFNAVSCSNFNSSASYQPFNGLNISTISIGDSVQRIPAHFAYSLVGLTNVTIGKSITEIGNYAFYNCSGLSGDLIIPDSVTTIGSYAFYNCSGLTSATIGISVQSIGNYAFQGCTSLATLDFNAVSCSNFNYNYYYAQELPFNNLNISTINIGNSVQRIPTYFAYDLAEVTHITIGNSVTEIGEYAFYGCGITDLVWNAKNCSSNGDMTTSNILHVTIGDEVETIPNNFANESKITEFSIPNSVSSIGSYAFNNCTGLSGELTISDSVTDLGYSAFQSCSGFTSITIGKSVTGMGSYAFSGCSGITDLIWNAKNCSFNGNMPTSNIVHVTIGDEVETIPDNFANGSKITELSIPNSVTSIGSYAFRNCAELSGELIIPNSVTTIGSYAFQNCSSLSENLIIPNSVTYIGNYAFQSCSGLSEVTIGNSVTSIGNYAFRYCSGLTSVTIPNSVTSIGSYAFEDCYELSSVNIGKSVTTIGDYAFYYCSNLRFLTWNAVNCTSIGNRAFWNYSYPIYVSSLQFGDGVEHIPAGLPSLSMYGQVLKIPNSVKTIDAGAIQGNCAGVVIGNGLENIPASSFSSGISVAYATTAEPSPCETGAFANPQTLYVPAGCKMKYFTASGWSEFANIIEGEYFPATAIELDKDSVRLYKDNSIQLTATILPDTASATSIGWFSTNYDVAWVEDGGMVYANAVGEADIIVWVDQVMDTCHVTVTPVMVENITLSANHMSMALDETYKLTATVTPENAENQTLEWEIPDNEVLLTQLVNNKNLNIGAAGEGTVTITVRATDGSGVSASCEVFVSANTPVKTLTLSPETLNLYVSYSEQLNAIITPQDAYTQELRWFSSNENVVTVNSNGVVYGRGLGTATITAVTTDGSNLSASCVVTVTNVPVESVTLNYSELEMYEGNYTYLYANVQPSNAMNKTLQWASSNPRVATVTNNGRVNALEVGSTIITATSTDGTDITASCRVTVINHTASNCFYIPNSEVLHGDTVTIPVQLNNVQDIMAFQTDIYLPAGFRIVTNEDDEFLITPSSRMTSDHVIMADRISDGAVRVICYTPQGLPFSDYEGDLFYMTIAAPENVSGDYSVNLRNNRMTSTDYTELGVPDAGAVITVRTYIHGDVNDSHTVTVTDIVVTAQYILQRNPSPFIFEAADMNGDGIITVTDIMLIAQLIMTPTTNAPKHMPALEANGDRMSGEDIALTAGETRTVNITLDNDMDYSAFQLDLMLPEGLSASNFQLTDRAGSHALDVNTLDDGSIRALCYSPAIAGISGHSGVLLTFDVTAKTDVTGNITVDGIEMVTTNCRTVMLDAFAIGVKSPTSVNELANGKTVARVEYFNLAGQQIERPEHGVTLIVTTYTDGTRTTTKVIR